MREALSFTLGGAMSKGSLIFKLSLLDYGLNGPNYIDRCF
jgi:hypothetical protein